MSQITDILKALKSGKRLTTLEALRQFGCMNLKGRIWDIKQMGYNIEKDWLKLKNKKSIAIYYLNNDVPPGTNYKLFKSQEAQCHLQV